MQDVTKLRVYREAETLVLLVYRLTQHFPREERFGLAQQMRRAAVSIGSNLAEGVGRDTDRELLRFVRIALGSATELEFQLRIARRLELADEVAIDECINSCRIVQRMLTRLAVRLRPPSRQTPSPGGS